MKTRSLADPCHEYCITFFNIEQILSSKVGFKEGTVLTSTFIVIIVNYLYTVQKVGVILQVKIVINNTKLNFNSILHNYYILSK